MSGRAEEAIQEALLITFSLIQSFFESTREEFMGTLYSLTESLALLDVLGLLFHYYLIHSYLL